MISKKFCEDGRAAAGWGKVGEAAGRVHCQAAVLAGDEALPAVLQRAGWRQAADPHRDVPAVAVGAGRGE